MLEKSARMSTEVIAMGEVDFEWVHLLLMARDAGISAEEVRQFLGHSQTVRSAIRSLA